MNSTVFDLLTYKIIWIRNFLTDLKNDKKALEVDGIRDFFVHIVKYLLPNFYCTKDIQTN